MEPGPAAARSRFRGKRARFGLERVRAGTSAYLWPKSPDAHGLKRENRLPRHWTNFVDALCRTGIGRWRHACCYNFHIDKIIYAPAEEAGLSDKIFRACGLRSASSVVLLVLLIGLGVTNLLMRGLSADYERRVRYVLVPDARANRPRPIPSIGGLSVAAAHHATGTQVDGSSSALDSSKGVIGKSLIGSPFDPASSQSISAETFGIRSLGSDNRIEAGFGEPFDRSGSREGMPRGLSLDAPAVKFSALSPYAAKYKPSAKQKGKTSASKTARTRKVKQKKKVSPVDAIFRSIRRILLPPEGNKSSKARSAKARKNSAD